MHENREISCTSWSADQDRSAKAINRTADVHVQEKSDCAVVPVNPAEQRRAAFGGGRGGKGADSGEHRSISHAPDTERETHVPGIARCATSSIRRHPSLVRAVCVNALVRICAGGDQRWSSLPRQLLGPEVWFWEVSPDRRASSDRPICWRELVRDRSPRIGTGRHSGEPVLGID
jgi:hypothetical protein